MARVRLHFTPQLRRFLDAPEQELEAGTPREALDQLRDEQPRLAAYLMDERGRVRAHVAVFVAGRLLRSAEDLDAPLVDGAEIHLLQALSGG
ncbi:MAG: MoaD/ThiS family protein [Planctomycetota bacterium]|nr:MoaD/ThiS family protein [Planctomycetota bacterium]